MAIAELVLGVRNISRERFRVAQMSYKGQGRHNQKGKGSEKR